MSQYSPISGDGDVNIKNTIGRDQIFYGAQTEKMLTQQDYNKIFEEVPWPQQPKLQEYFIELFNGGNDDVSKEIRRSLRQQLARGVLLKHIKSQQDFSFVVFLDERETKSIFFDDPKISYKLIQLRQTEVRDGPYLVYCRSGQVYYTQSFLIDIYWFDELANAIKFFYVWKFQLAQQYGFPEYQDEFVIIENNNVGVEAKFNDQKNPNQKKESQSRWGKLWSKIKSLELPPLPPSPDYIECYQSLSCGDFYPKNVLYVPRKKQIKSMVTSVPVASNMYFLKKRGAVKFLVKSPSFTL